LTSTVPRRRARSAGRIGAKGQRDARSQGPQHPRAGSGAWVARFSFADLCEAPLGSLDYQRIAHSFHTLIVEAIPVLGPEKRNQARRLMTLIDALYDNGVGLIASAEAEPHALYGEGDGTRSFARTASRLREMRSEAYLRAGRRHRNPRRGSG